MSYREVARRLWHDPKVVLDRLYFEIRGIRVIEMKNAYENDEGTLLALTALNKNRVEGGVGKIDILQQVVGSNAHSKDTQEMGNLFAQYGSDKSTRHNYHLIYAYLLKGKRAMRLRILEIGLGTNNTNFLSNMGRDGKPGAAERAFRDWAPQSQVYGADIDKGILFSEERIQTFFVDQTKPESLKELASQFPKHSFDLIIDDGLHNTWANLNTLNFALELIKPNGVVVIEDIVEKYLPIWKMTASLLANDYHCQLIQCKTESVFIVKKAAV